MRSLLCACVMLVALAPAWARADSDPSLREDGVLYFEDNLPSKITAVIRAPTTIYLRRDFQSALAGLDPGQRIELVGMSPEGYLVKGTYRNNTVSGWILPQDLPPGIDPALFEQAKKNQARSNAVATAIANKAVIRGMTPDEVQQSVGRPEQISSHVDASGSVFTWIFTTYAEQLQTSYAPGIYGRPILQTYPVKVAIGQLIVSFANGGVVAVEEHKTDPNSPGVVTN